MPDATPLLIAAVFALAGLVKRVAGLGLPITMPPVEAAAILFLPSIVTAAITGVFLCARTFLPRRQHVGFAYGPRSRRAATRNPVRVAVLGQAV
jgi:hypothetical protein